VCAQIARIGGCGLVLLPLTKTRVEALRLGLRQLGYVEGRNIVIEFRCAVRHGLGQSALSLPRDRKDRL
jgi:hypothetical protein